MGEIVSIVAFFELRESARMPTAISILDITRGENHKLSCAADGASSAAKSARMVVRLLVWRLTSITSAGCGAAETAVIAPSAMAATVASLTKENMAVLSGWGGRCNESRGMRVSVRQYAAFMLQRFRIELSWKLHEPYLCV